MTTLANIENGNLGFEIDVLAMATALASSADNYAIENFIASLIYVVNKYENTLVDPSTPAKTNASWGVNGSGIVSFSVKGLCKFAGGIPSIGEPAV